MQDPSPVFLPGIRHSEIDPARQGLQRLGIGVVVILLATLTGLAYVYRPTRVHTTCSVGATAGALRSSSDAGSSVPPETSVAAPASQPQVITPSGAKGLDNIAETTARNVASSEASRRQAGLRDVDKAAHIERQGLQALVAVDFKEAQRLFQASENAAIGFHYSYEWAQLLQTRQAELETLAGRKTVLQFALSKGYASYAPKDIRDKLRQLAQ